MNNIVKHDSQIPMMLVTHLLSALKEKPRQPEMFCLKSAVYLCGGTGLSYVVFEPHATGSSFKKERTFRNARFGVRDTVWERQMAAAEPHVMVFLRRRMGRSVLCGGSPYSRNFEKRRLCQTPLFFFWRITVLDCIAV